MNPAFIALGGANIGLIGLAALDSRYELKPLSGHGYASAESAQHQPHTSEQDESMKEASAQAIHSLMYRSANGRARTCIESLGSGAVLGSADQEQLRWLMTGKRITST